MAILLYDPTLLQGNDVIEETVFSMHNREQNNCDWTVFFCNYLVIISFPMASLTFVVLAKNFPEFFASVFLPKTIEEGVRCINIKESSFQSLI